MTSENETQIEVATPEGVADIERNEDLSGDPEFEAMLNGLSVAGEAPLDVKIPSPVAKDSEVVEQEPTEEDELDLSSEKDDSEEESEEEESEELDSDSTEEDDSAEEEVSEDEVVEKKEKKKEKKESTDDPSPTQAQLDALQIQLREVSSTLLRERAAHKEEKIQTEPDFKIKPIELSSEQLNDILANPESFAKFSEGLIRQGAALGREAALRDMNSTISSEVRNHVSDVQRSAEFYRANPDLRGNEFVKLVAAEMIQASMKDGVPTITQADLTANLAAEVRKRMGMPQKPKATRKKSKAPKLPGSKARKPAPKKLTGMEKDLAEMQYDDEKARYLNP